MNKNKATLVVEHGIKKFRSQNYSYDFNMVTGFFERWGKTKETKDDPQQSPAPEILDIETSINGCPKGKSGKICNFCLPKGMQITTPNGKVYVENIKQNDLVIGFNVEKQTPRLQTVKETYERWYEGDLVCIELENGNVLKLTPNHEVYTKNRGWIVSKDIIESDEVIHF